MSEKKQIFGYLLNEFGVLQPDGSLEKKLVEIRKFTAGHINKTFLIHITDHVNAEDYVLQSINRNVYPNPERLMRNLETIGAVFSENAENTDSVSVGETRVAVPCFMDVDGRNYLEIGGECWRMYHYVPERKEEPKTPFQVGLAYGSYIKLLNENVTKLDLQPAVEGYHDFGGYYSKLLLSTKDNLRDYSKDNKKEHSFETFRTFREKLDTIFTPEMPKRYIHGDAKADNIIIQPDGTCTILDLDTTMMHYAALDYGDMIRSVTAGKQEEEMLESIRLATAGFAKGLNGILTPMEVDSLFYGILWVTWELAVRYLTDCYSAEKYFANMSTEQCRERVQQLIAQSEEFSGIKEQIKLSIEAEFVKYTK